MTINTTGLLGPQIQHVKRLVDSLYANGFALDMSETGTGKSYSAAAVAREMNRPVVLISPKTVLPQCKKILKLF
jgi:superfamily II DNA or RNA helicase